MYKNTSTNQQNSRQHIKITEMMSGDQVLTIEQRRENIHRRRMQLEDELIHLPVCDKRKKSLGQQIQSLQNELSALPKVRGMGHYYMRAAKSILTQAQHEEIENRARVLMVNDK